MLVSTKIICCQQGHISHSIIDSKIFVRIEGELFKIGFDNNCFILANDLSIPNNRYLSSSHCIFEFDNGHIYIRDTSSNGTLINRSKKINKNDSVKYLLTNNMKELMHIYLAY